MACTWIKLIFGAALAGVLEVAHLWAVPSISGVSGTLSGQANSTSANQVTLTGSGFGTLWQKPSLWATMETSTNPTNMGFFTSWSGNENMTFTTTQQRTNSSGSAMGTWDPGVNAFSFFIDYTKWETVYTYGRRRFDFANTANQKTWRLWKASGSTPDFLQATANDGMCYNECNTSQEGRFQAYSYAANTTYIEEYVWTVGSNLGGPEVNGNGYWRHVRDGTEVQVSTKIANCENDHKHLRVLENFTDSAARPADGSKVWMDDLYVSTTTARVMLGNASTFSASTQREIQIPISGNATSVTVYFHQGAFANAATAYFYVCDGSVPDSCNSSGFQLTIGSEGIGVAKNMEIQGSFSLSGSVTVK